MSRYGPGYRYYRQNASKSVVEIDVEGDYACGMCSLISTLTPSPEHDCPRCGNRKWIAALSHSRVS
ncbi:Uncharacterised protein [Serratia fonticola]|uniref:Rubredoxin-like domain-containing protein n=1 Tax=Serratia fonticola TaxID=47917 RepID=A0A4U9UWZ9_SERFO|nr:Uncharacterised protein [Serratia fonticola]